MDKRIIFITIFFLLLLFLFLEKNIKNEEIKINQTSKENISIEVPENVTRIGKGGRIKIVK
ncbi:MAG: hypothetical protein QW156_04905 [Candidatus Aenigmatarchaeota archaeon]